MFRSLRAKLLLSHLGLVLLAMVILGGYLVQNMDWFYLETVQARIRNDAAVLAERMAPDLVAGNQDAVRKYLADMAPSIEVRVLVTDADGVIVGSTEPEDTQLVGRPGTLRGVPRAIRSRIERVIQRPGDPMADVVFLAAPIEYQGNQVGGIRLSYQLRDLDMEVDKLTNILVVGLGAATAVGLLVTLVLAQSLSAPARRLVTAVKAVSSGDLSYRTHPTGRDEIRDAARAFDSLAERLQQLEQARQRLLGDVAHDIHSSITGVSMAVEALQQGAMNDSAMRALLLDGLASHSHRLHRLADDLLESARIEGGKLRLECTGVHPSKVMKDVAAEFTAEADQQRVALQLLEGNDLPMVWADVHRIAQALGNLVENAIRFTPAGGKVHIGGEARNGECVLYVSDEGPGIAEEDQAGLFDRFKRFESERPGRLGFGLAIAKALTEAHGGRIEVSSTPGHGATFSIILPAVKEDEDGCGTVDASNGTPEHTASTADTGKVQA
jgi:two-component system, OmpR family, sensor histidine kinase BaeS